MARRTAEQTQQAWKRGLRRELERDYRRRQREKLRKLRDALKAAKRRRTEAVAGVVAECRRARAETKRRIAAARKQAREQINAERDRRIRTDRAACAAGKGTARARGAQAVDAAERAYRAELAEIQGERAWTGRRRKEPSRREQRAESDGEVEGNLPPELVAVWRKVKRRVHAGPRSTRTEAFLQWVHDNSAEVARIRDQAIERDVERLIAAEQEQRERAEAPLSHLTDEQLVELHNGDASEVPF